MRLRGLIVLGVALGFAGCGGPPTPPDQAVRDWVAAAETAAEERDIGAVRELVAAGYADARGNDREDLDRLLRLLFLRQKSIGLLVSVEDIEILGTTAANVSLTVGMAATNDATFGFSADAYRFELVLEQRDDDWQLIGARWGELGQPPR